MDVRLILDPPASGSWNMAVDEALLASAADEGRATLRFYGWNKATLSLGYFQPHAAREEHASSCHLPWVRRRSGGGAIVHHHEVTYSFAAPLVDRFAHAQRWVRWFHETLREVLADWSIPIKLCDATVPAPQPPFLCFQRRTENDLLLGGHKIGGSAERRHRRAGLIHGSVLLRGTASAPELPGICELAPRDLASPVLAARWVSLLARRYSWNMQTTELTAGERARAERFREERFGQPAWNQRR